MHENGLSKPSFSEIIDTTNKEVIEITEEIILKLNLKKKIEENKNRAVEKAV